MPYNLGMMKQITIEKRAVKLKEAAALLSCSPRTLRRAIRRGDLKSCRWMRHVMIPVAEIVGFINRSEQSVEKEGGA